MEPKLLRFSDGTYIKLVAYAKADISGIYDEALQILQIFCWYNLDIWQA